ncbi:MAG: flavodoxin family protein [Anaerolineae bacterium]|nr:flavodoxin family protein [Anaerolineae bacterium]
MNVLGISGTPRKNGNSDILLQHALRPFEEAGWEVRLLRLRELTVTPCLACDLCTIHGSCALGDDDMHLFYDAFRWCDALIVATPTYSRNVSAQLLAVMDRHYGVREERPLAGKAGGAIAVGRGTCGGQTIAINAIYTWMLSCGAVCVPGELNGLTAVADEPGDVLKQEKRLRQARVLGENVMHVAEMLRKA